MSLEHCENLVIGSGEAGKYLAWSLAKQGQRTVVVERDAIGGACPNVACLPSKNVIHSAKVASLVRNAARFGFETGTVEVNMSAISRRKQEMIAGLHELHWDRFRESGAELIFGEARFTAPKSMRIALNGGGERTLRGERVFLAVGTRASVPAVPGLRAVKPLTHVEALQLDRLPSHLVILGGGYVGLEFAQAMRRFGSEVTVVQHGPQLLAREDPDVAQGLLEVMQDDGMAVRLNAELRQASGSSGEAVTLQLSTATGVDTLEASDILAATGRTPNTDRLDAALAGVELDARGYIRVNERLETTAPDVWAMGDCAGSPHFTHASFDDYRIVRDNFAGLNRTTRNRLVPYCLFTDPELVRVGLSETEAKWKGITYRLAKIPMSAIMRTRTHSEDRGFAKALVGADDRILGFAALGAEASELLAAVQTAMLGGMPYTTLRDGIFTHPTIAEGLTVLFANVATLPR